MFAMEEKIDILVDYGKTSRLYNNGHNSLFAKETLYRMLQEGENSIASGKTLTKEEVLKNMEAALNT